MDGRSPQADRGDSLEAYRSKRDPAKTPEPMGGRRMRARRRPSFVIQEHHARSLHWDLRLERDGVLVSWALPKGLPESPKKNHLAVHTEDHPLEYATFEGDIPVGQYGAGRITIWDRGYYDTEKWTDTEVKFQLHGDRAHGGYVLFQTDGRNWMIHHHAPADAVDELPGSVLPMLAVPGSLPPDDGAWAFEVKWDGVRALLFVEGGRVRVHSRNDRDVTATFPELAEVGASVGMRSCVVDGEIIAFDAEGRPSFAALQQRLNVADPREARRRVAEEPVQFVAFDLLYLDGRSLLSQPYDERRAALESLHFKGRAFSTTDSFRDVPGRDVLEATRAGGLEGVVAKRRDSPYRPGQRVSDWVKVKTVRTQEVVLGGWTPGRGERAGGLGALLLGIPEPDGLRFVGKVGTGFSDAERASLLGLLAPLAVPSSGFTSPPPTADAKVATYVRPELVGEVAYTEWTTAGRLRQPVWRGLRRDKSADEVVVEEDGPGHPVHREEAAAPGGARRPAARPGGTGGSGSVRVSVEDREISVSNLEKVLYPQTGFTKGQLIDYYVHIAPAMLPHLRDRPLTMKRFPDGVEGNHFFEKHVPSHAPPWVRTVTVPSEHHADIAYAVVDDLPTLVWAANLGTIEFHVPLWHAGRRRTLPARPDFVVFDLDPGEGTSLVECCRVAVLIAADLEADGLELCAKTSGMKGLQLYVPVGDRTGWDATRQRAHEVARRLERDHADLVVSRMNKSLRRGRVLIDWSQNHPAKTTVCAYSVRAAPRPTVSTPVALDEVAACARRGDPSLLRFETSAVLDRVDAMGDLLAPLRRT